MRLNELQVAALQEAAKVLNSVTIDGDIALADFDKLHRVNNIVLTICEAVRRDWCEEKAKEGGK